jgi:tetratricopeptide (TPR) repeat protein
MRRLFLVFVCVSFCISTGLVGQTYQDGIDSYKKANVAQMVNDKDGERKALEEAWQIFEKLASVNDSKSLVMYYLISLKLGKTVSLQQQLNQYVKTEHPGYPTIETESFLGEDKTFILDKIKKKAAENEQKAKELLNEARDYAANEKYQEAMDKLSEAENLWEIDGIDMLKNKYQRLNKEKQSALVVKRAKDLTRQGLYQDAIKTVDSAVGLLEPSEIASLKGEIKKSWYQKVFNEANIEYKNKNYSQAISKCDEAYAILSTDEALKLKRKCQKKMKPGKPRTGALFADFGINAVIKPNDMNYHWNGNSIRGLDMSDLTAVTSEIATEKEDQPKVGYALSGGLMVLFSPSFGMFASVAYTKQDLNIQSAYTFRVTFDDGTGGSFSENFTDTGSISVMPVSLDLVVLLKIGAVGTFNLYAGPTFFLSNLDLNTRIGYGGLWRRSNGVWQFDWFPLEYQVKKKESVFGGNVGADLEFRTGKSAAFYLGFQYYFAPAKEFDWELIEKRYDGKLGYFYTTDPAHELGPMPDYKTEVALSTYKIHLGLRIYF